MAFLPDEGEVSRGSRADRWGRRPAFTIVAQSDAVGDLRVVSAVLYGCLPGGFRPVFGALALRASGGGMPIGFSEAVATGTLHGRSLTGRSVAAAPGCAPAFGPLPPGCGPRADKRHGVAR